MYRKRRQQELTGQEPIGQEPTYRQEPTGQDLIEMFRRKKYQETGQEPTGQYLVEEFKKRKQQEPTEQEVIEEYIRKKQKLGQEPTGQELIKELKKRRNQDTTQGEINEINEIIKRKKQETGQEPTSSYVIQEYKKRQSARKMSRSSLMGGDSHNITDFKNKIKNTNLQETEDEVKLYVKDNNYELDIMCKNNYLFSIKYKVNNKEIINEYYEKTEKPNRMKKFYSLIIKNLTLADKDIIDSGLDKILQSKKCTYHCRGWHNRWLDSSNDEY